MQRTPGPRPGSIASSAFYSRQLQEAGFQLHFHATGDRNAVVGGTDSGFEATSTPYCSEIIVTLVPCWNKG